MNLALIVGERRASLQEIGSTLSGLGLRVETCASVSILVDNPNTPRVLLLDEEAGNALAGVLPAGVAAAPIRLAISASGRPIPGIQRLIAPPITEEALLEALLDAGYHLPADAECAAITTALHALVDGDPVVVAELLDSLINTGEADLNDYQARCAEGHWAAAGSLAHRIKGTARMAGCVSLTRVCERIEASVHTEAGPALARLNLVFVPGVRRLCATLRRLRQTP